MSFISVAERHTPRFFELPSREPTLLGVARETVELGVLERGEVTGIDGIVDSLRKQGFAIDGEAPR